MIVLAGTWRLQIAVLRLALFFAIEGFLAPLLLPNHLVGEILTIFVVTGAWSDNFLTAQLLLGHFSDLFVQLISSHKPLLSRGKADIFIPLVRLFLRAVGNAFIITRHCIGTRADFLILLPLALIFLNESFYSRTEELKALRFLFWTETSKLLANEILTGTRADIIIVTFEDIVDTASCWGPGSLSDRLVFPWGDLATAHYLNSVVFM